MVDPHSNFFDVEGGAVVHIVTRAVLREIFLKALRAGTSSANKNGTTDAKENRHAGNDV
jgi:hypothetical protein